MTVKRTKQSWQVGETVKVGFMTLTVRAIVVTPGNYLPDQYALSSLPGQLEHFYRFVPHNGLERCANLAEAMEWKA